jgi:hypothetical protein
MVNDGAKQARGQPEDFDQRQRLQRATNCM